MLRLRLAVLCLVAFTGVTSRREKDNRKLLDDTLTAVEKASRFFASDYSAINLDGVFGIRLAQGEILASFESCKKSNCDELLVDRLQRLDEEMERSTVAAMPYVQQSDPAYFRLFFDVINKPFNLTSISEKLSVTEKTTIGHDSHYPEEKGDDCFGRIMGSAKEKDGKKVAKCTTTDDCIEMMTETDARGYRITHQLLYFLLIDHVDCTEKVAKDLKLTSIRNIERDLCTRIYKEAEGYVNDPRGSDVVINMKGRVRNFQDLFMEECAMCGALGFENFMRGDWMKMVMGWQTPEGCYKDSKMIKHFKNAQHSLPFRMRKLQRETIMEDGCLAHSTGLLIATLATYARSLVQSPNVAASLYNSRP